MWGAGVAALAAVLVWTYSTVLVGLWAEWMRNDNYSSGVLVLPLSIYIVYVRRQDLAKALVRPWYWGVVVVGLGFAMRLLGTLLYFGSAERLSLVVVIIGLVVTIFGLRLARRIAWILAFLFLMLPWPGRVYQAVSLPLQSHATTSAVFLLETLGYAVAREGNVVHVGPASVAVAEACSGLRMLTAFMVVSAFVAFLCRRPWWQKAVLFVSSVLIALLCNTIRLTVTAIAFTGGYGEKVNTLFHDYGGYAMMPLALAILVGELWLMKRLVVVVPADTTPETPAGTPVPSKRRPHTRSTSKGRS